MALVKMFLCIICLIVICSMASKDIRKKELSRIKNYELIYFNLDHFASDKQIAFDLFNQHYVVQLVVNEDAVPSQINPLSGHPGSLSDKSSKWFTSRTQSCHYFGHILSPQTSASHILNVALSLCPNRGIRGSITINNEKVFIKPAAYYLDEKVNRYHLSDQHLIYKSSDYQHDDLPQPRASKLIDDNHDDERHHSQSPSSRKLLASKTLELYLLSDYTQTKDFKDDHGGDWYQELLAHALDYVNSAAVEYVGDDFSRSDVGAVTLKLVRFEVVESWDGEYRGLRPPDYSSSEIDGDDYLSQFREWMIDNDRNNYDAHQLWTLYKMEDSAGWGSVGCICDGKCSSNVSKLYGEAWDVRVVAHELGHNFGADHDDDAGCDGNSGIMGFGDDLIYHGFSSCSIKAFEDYYDESGGLRCLNSDSRSFSSNIAGGNDQAVDDTDNYGTDDTYDTPPTSSGNCVILSGFSSQINGEWAQGGTYSNKPYFTRGKLKLFYDSVNENVHIDSTLGTGANWYCEGSSIIQCTRGKWYSRKSNGEWNSDTDRDATVAQCAGGTTNNGGDNGGDDGSDFTYDEGGDCVRIRQLKPYLDTNWVQVDTRNGKPVYRNQQAAKYYLYYINEDGEYWWTISTNVVSKSDSNYNWDLGWCGAQDIKSCDGQWDGYDGKDTNVVFDDCGGFDIDQVPQCVKDNEYESSLCLYSNDSESLWNDDGNGGYKEFTVSLEECQNDKPVYKYVYNESDEAAIVYYLHYNEYRKYVYSVDVTPQWIISRNIIKSSGVAYCDDSDLLNCTQGKWQIYTTGQDTVKLIDDETMRILNRQCFVESVAENTADDKVDFTLYILISIVLIVTLFCCVVAVLIRCGSKRKKVVIIDDCSEDETEEEEEIEISMETNTQLET